MRHVPLNEYRLKAIPQSDIERLMQGDDSEQNDTTHNDIVADILDTLDEKMRDVVLAVFFEQIPFSELGERLGCSKTHAFRMAKAAQAEVERHLLKDQHIIERYDLYSSLYDNWEDAAMGVIGSYDGVVGRPANIGVIDFCANDLAKCVRDRTHFESFMFNSIGMEAVAELKHRAMWDIAAFHTLLCGKQADYGHDNINAFGHIGIAVRLHDKIARLHNLASKAAVNEPLLDTWHDLIGYATLAEMLYQNTFNLPLKGDK